MATAVVLRFQGGTLEGYDAVLNAADMQGKPASFIPGLSVHAVYPIDGGFEIFDIWDSVETFNTHFAKRIAPAMEKVGLAIRPDMNTFEIHNSML